MDKDQIIEAIKGMSVLMIPYLRAFLAQDTRKYYRKTQYIRTRSAWRCESRASEYRDDQDSSVDGSN